MIRVFIVARVRLYCDALAKVLAGSDSLGVVGTHVGGNGAVAHLAANRPDVALLDMAIPRSYELARQFQRSAPEMAVVALGVGGSEPELLSCAEAGIAGYVHADASLDEVIAVIQSAARGELFCSPRLAREFARRLAALAGTRAPDPQAPLTPREREIVVLLEQHLSNKEIASHLGVGVKTVRDHVQSVLKKLDVHRRYEAVRAPKPAQGAVAALPAPMVVVQSRSRLGPSHVSRRRSDGHS